MVQSSAFVEQRHSKVKLNNDDDDDDDELTTVYCQSGTIF